MSLEIERKFLLSSFPERARECPCVEILQGYFLSPNTNEECRVRKLIYHNNIVIEKAVYYLTKKSSGTISREEKEVEISRDIFQILWDFTEDRRIKKNRYYFSVLKNSPLFWNIDVYFGRLEGLILAEIEIPSVDFELDIPNIIQKVLVREVTDEDKYKNKNLSKESYDVLFL